MLALIKNWWAKKQSRFDDMVEGKEKPKLPQEADTVSLIRVGAGLLLLALGGFIYWASTAPIDEGIPANGVVAVESKRKSVQHLSGGIVAELMVREAQRVKAGDPLIVLDRASIQANHDAAEKAFIAAATTEARLTAEQTGASELVFPPTITGRPPGPLTRSFMDNQRALFHSRRAALDGELQVMAESAANYESQAASYGTQLEFLKQELAGLRALSAEGYVARNRHLEMERQFTELLNSQQRAKQSAIEVRARAMQRRQDYRKEVETQLAEIRRDASIAAEKLTVAREDLSRTVIKSPSDGFVVGLMVHTVGGVISPGQRLMDIVPADVPLIVETQIPAHLIDRVFPGLLANISLQVFPNRPDLVIDGKVVSVSADLVTDPNPNIPPYYLGRVEVTPAGVAKLGPHVLQPGMPASVVILTGERTFFTYLAKPLLRRLQSALTEY